MSRAFLVRPLLSSSVARLWNRRPLCRWMSETEQRIIPPFLPGVPRKPSPPSRVWRWIRRTFYVTVVFPTSVFSLYYFGVLDRLRPEKKEPDWSNDIQALENTIRGKSPSDLDVVLYQYETCPFCNKLRAFLDFHKIPYRSVEVHPFTKKEIKFSEKYRKVPILVIDGIQLNDSSQIISTLSKTLFGNSLRSEDGNPTEEMIWMHWIDEVFIHAVAPNVYRSLKESFKAFDYIREHSKFQSMGGEVTAVTGAILMWAIAKGIKRKYGIKNPRKFMYSALNEFMDEVGDQSFLGGKIPNNADLALFGILRAMKNLPTEHDFLNPENCRIGPWYERMTEVVGSSSRIEAL